MSSRFSRNLLTKRRSVSNARTTPEHSIFLHSCGLINRLLIEAIVVSEAINGSGDLQERQSSEDAPAILHVSSSCNIQARSSSLPPAKVRRVGLRSRRTEQGSTAMWHPAKSANTSAAASTGPVAVANPPDHPIVPTPHVAFAAFVAASPLSDGRAGPDLSSASTLKRKAPVVVSPESQHATKRERLPISDVATSKSPRYSARFLFSRSTLKLMRDRSVFGRQTRSSFVICCTSCFAFTDAAECTQ